MGKPIRVLCVFSTLDRGGAESMCMNLYRHIDRNEVQFDFVKHTPKKGNFEDEILELGGRIFEAPRYKAYNTIQYRYWWKRHLEGHPEHQIIHGHFFTISAVYFSVAKRLGRKTIGHVHASGADEFLKGFLTSQINRVTDYPIACSQQAGEWIYGKRPFKVLNNALDTELFHYNEEKRKEYRDKLNLGNCLVLGTVANLSSVKNPMGLIDIFLKVHAKQKDSKLLWVGEGAQRNLIEERIKQEGITDSVFLLGQRGDVNKLLQAMDAFLLPSLNEGLPVSLIEAQASGLPCYVSNTVTTEADITRLCRFLPLNEWDQWADAILSDKTPRTDTGQKIIEAGYDIRTTAAWLQDFYLEIANKRRQEEQR